MAGRNIARPVSELYLTLFNVEVNLQPLGYVLGGFICVPWPEWCRNDDPAATFKAMEALAPEGVKIEPDIRMLEQFVQYNRLRQRVDNKCQPAMFMFTPTPVSKDYMARLIAGWRTDKLEAKLKQMGAQKL